MRHQVLKRDKYVCHLCGKPGADSVDHVIAGDDHSRDNLRAVHDASFPHCHKKKTAMEAVQARKLRDPDASVIARARMKGLL